MCSTRMRLAAVLREQRISLGLTLRQAAARAELAPSTLSRWESGSCIPRVSELESFFKSLGAADDKLRRILFSIDAPRALQAVRAAERSEEERLTAPSAGTLLRALRRRRGHSISELAGIMGVSSSALSRWESGHTRPSPAHLGRLLTFLEATDDVRKCLSVSGIAKLHVNSSEYDREALLSDVERIENNLSTADEDIELTLLQIQSRLWWFRDQEGATDLHIRARVCYCEFLCLARRYHEAAVQAQNVTESICDATSSLFVRAQRVLARAEVYRWPKVRPHLGLLLLQQYVSSEIDGKLKHLLLEDMAEFSTLADRLGEAAVYAGRAEGRTDPLTVVTPWLKVS